MSDITPLAAYHQYFRLAFLPDHQPASDTPFPLPPKAPPAEPVAPAKDNVGAGLPPQPGLLTFSFFGNAGLP